MELAGEWARFEAGGPGRDDVACEVATAARPPSLRVSTIRRCRPFEMASSGAALLVVALRIVALQTVETTLQGH